MKRLDEMYGAIVLSEEDVAQYLEEIGWIEIISAVKETFMEEARKNVISPPKTIIDIDKYENDYRVMPSYMLAYPHFIGTKIVCACPGNAGTEYPFAMASYILNDARVQKPILICGARNITAYRTAAATAVAVQKLSRPRSEILGIIGCGVQADFHIPAICTIRPIKKIIVNDINEECADRVCTLGCDDVPIEKGSKEWILQECDIIVTLTPTTRPFIFREDIPNREMLICAVGGDSEHKIELEPSILSMTDHYCDSYEQAAHTGMVHQAFNEKIITSRGLKSLGDYMMGYKNANSEPVKLFLSTGVALEDLVMAILLYHKAKGE